MEFGKVEPHQLAAIDFTLPPDPAFTTDTLKQQLYQPTKELQVNVGFVNWGSKDWVG